MGAGDFVQVKMQKVASLDVPTRPHILKVVRLKECGVVVLQYQNKGQNGATLSLPIVDKKIYRERCFSGDKTSCRECCKKKNKEAMVLCDRC